MRFYPDVRVWMLLLSCLVLNRTPGQTVPVENASFELPATDFVELNLVDWQKVPKPEWFVESPETGTWDQLVGVFKDTPDDPLGNIDQSQAIYIFVVPQAGFFQDLSSGAELPQPITFEPGESYELKFGLVGGRGDMVQGVALTAMLYYRDATGNFVPVGQTVVTNSTNVFPNISTLVDFSVNVPTVQPTDAWAGKQIGIFFVSTPDPQLQFGGYWDLDNVRLTKSAGTVSPTLAFAREGSNLRVSWSSAAGKNYQLESTTDLKAWTAYGAELPGTGMELSESLPIEGERLFVRLRESEAP